MGEYVSLFAGVDVTISRSGRPACVCPATTPPGPPGVYQRRVQAISMPQMLLITCPPSQLASPLTLPLTPSTLPCGYCLSCRGRVAMPESCPQMQSRSAMARWPSWSTLRSAPMAVGCSGVPFQYIATRCVCSPRVGCAWCCSCACVPQGRARIPLLAEPARTVEFLRMH